ncbi:hypothetical protein GYN02_23635 [Pseudomonas weihenstephanensis]|uniref:Uncharacterized protein n=2 Tax=Pseudomonas weihenstephanensis TaxID=1608994 RepID=A0ABS1ZNT7_9PSED|nr:hypothetical protein [Pseudomonas weihenstephanensis]
MRDHHLIPQAMMKDKAFMAQMKAAGISNPTDYIHRQISRITNTQHIDIHDAGWNKDFKTWFMNNPNFTKKDLQTNIKGMMTKHNLPKSSRNHIRRYNSKCGA